MKNAEELRQEAICPALLLECTKHVTAATIDKLILRLRDPEAEAADCARHKLSPHDRKLVMFAAIRAAAKFRNKHPPPRGRRNRR